MKELVISIKSSSEGMFDLRKAFKSVVKRKAKGSPYKRKDVGFSILQMEKSSYKEATGIIYLFQRTRPHQRIYNTFFNKIQF